MAFYTDSVVDVLTVSDSGQDDLSVWNVDAIPIAKYLPEKFRKVPWFADMVSSMWKLIAGDIEDTVQKIIKLRDPLKYENDYAEKVAGLLGFYQDISNQSIDQKRRLINSLPYWYERLGTNVTFNFLNFLFNDNIQVVPLYTQDYVNFYSTPQGVMEPAGPWYLTNHIDITYAASSGILDINTIQTRFYLVAPVPLVIRNISGVDLFSNNCQVSGIIHVEGFDYFVMDSKLEPPILNQFYPKLPTLPTLRTRSSALYTPSSSRTFWFNGVNSKWQIAG